MLVGKFRFDFVQLLGELFVKNVMDFGCFVAFKLFDGMFQE